MGKAIGTFIVILITGVYRIVTGYGIIEPFSESRRYDCFLPSAFGYIRILVLSRQAVC